MTRALHITRDFPPRSVGGLSTAVGQMVDSLVELGVDCAVISFDDWRPRSGPNTGGTTESRGDTAIARVKGPDALESAAELARTFAPTVIHLHHSMMWPFAARLRSELGIPAVKSIHVAHAHQNALRELATSASLRAQRDALESADAVIAPSPAAARAACADVPGVEPRLSVIPLGTRDSEGARAAASHPDQRDPGLVLYAGRFADINGTQEMLAALPSILRNRPGAHAVMAGGLPANRKAETRWRERWTQDAPADIVARVEFPGWLDAAKLSTLYGTCGVLVCPSWFETFGLVVVEGMLHGAPIAASRCGGTESTLVHRESGYLFGARDVGALIEATGTLLDDRALAQRLGARAAQVARAKFGWPDIAARIAALYDSLS